MLRSHGLHTVCEEARCPNRSECFARPTATFLIMGPECTRNCSFCSVDTAGTPSPLDPDEPARIASASLEMGLSHVVITSVTRDDLEDGGAGHFAATVTALRAAVRSASIEVLTPDFNGSGQSLRTVLASGPSVFNHNVETVPSLYPSVRPQAQYDRSLALLAESKKIDPAIRTKSGLMLGLGESMDEVLQLLEDLRSAGCDFITIGQYMRPGRNNLPVKEYIRPEVFDKLKLTALAMGFLSVASAPLVRSSMNAGEMYNSFSGEK